MLRIAIAMLLCTLPVHAHAQPIRETTSIEFVGYWKLIPVANERQPRGALTAAPIFQGLCQYFVHGEDGAWWHVDVRNAAGDAETTARCNLTRNDLRARVSTLGKSTFTWRKQSRPFITINRETNTFFAWKVDTVESDMATQTKLGFDLKRGDMIMQLLNKEMNAVVWQLILRPVD